jgi:autotransporter-associated beta strand protein
MKLRFQTLLFFRNLTVSFAALAIAPSAFAVSATWDGGAGTTNLNTAVNWNPDTAVPGATNGDTATWNGTQTGPLSLSWSANIGPISGNSGGLNLSITGTQTDSLTLDGATGALGLGNITIASGAGAFTLGDGSGTSTVNLRSSSLFTNNSSNTATLGADVRLGNGNGITSRVINFGGSGNWLVNNAITSTSYNVQLASLNITRSGTGTLTMAAADSGYGGGTTIGVNGTGTRTGIVRAAATQSLGTGTVLVGIGGNDTTARLELAGGISLNNAISLPGRQNSTASIQNISGNNTLSGVVSIASGGGTYIIQSDADTLTLSNSVTNSGGSVRSVTLQGAGNGLASGVISNGNGTLAVTKAGAGTWTLSNDSTYTGATQVSAGTLLVNGSLANTAVSVNGGTLGGTGTIAGTVAVANSATLSPGVSIQSLTTGALTMASGSIFTYEAEDVSSIGADLLAVSSSLSLTGVTLGFTPSTLVALTAGSWFNGDKLTLMSYVDAGSGITSGFTGYADDTSYLFGTNQWLFNYNDNAAGSNFTTDATANGQNRFVTLTLVPEPSAILLGGLGALGLLRRRR